MVCTGKLVTVTQCSLLVRYLVFCRHYMLLVHSGLFRSCWFRGYPTLAIKAGMGIIIVYYSGIYICIMYHNSIYVYYSSVVGKMPATPFAAGITFTSITI